MAPAIAEISMKPMPGSQKSSLKPGGKYSGVSGGFMNPPAPAAQLARTLVPDLGVGAPHARDRVACLCSLR